MKKTSYILSILVASMVLWGCKKTSDYAPVPYACNCGAVSWQGSALNLLDANYVLPDEMEEESRRYYITTDAQLLGEFYTHGLNTIIEIPDIDGGGNFYIDE